MDTVVRAGLRASAGQGGALKLEMEVKPERLSFEGQAMTKMGAQAELDGGLELRSHSGSAAKANGAVGIGPQVGLDLNGGLGRDNQEGETRLRLQGELKAILGLELSAELVLKDKDIEGACCNLLGQTTGNVVAGTVTGALDCLPRGAHLLKRLANATGEVAQSTISLLT